MVVVPAHVVINGVVVTAESTLEKLRVDKERDDDGEDTDDESSHNASKNLETERGLHPVVTETIELVTGVAAAVEDGGHFSLLCRSLLVRA